MSLPRLLPAWAATVALCLSAAAQTTSWIDTSPEGAWHVGDNWSHGVPAWDMFVYITNGGRAHISTDGQAAGSLYLGESVGQSGSLSVSAGRLDATNAYVGREGFGRVLQTGGYVWIRTLSVAHYTSGVGEYELTGGTLEVYSVAYIGLDGSASFIQSGGTFTAGRIDLSAVDTSYELSNGELNAGGLNVGGAARSSVTQTGGTLNVGTIVLGKFSSSTDNTFDFDAGDINADSVFIGDCGNATFTQRGGIHTVVGNVTFGNRSALQYPQSRGTYQLESGELHVQGDVVMANGSRDNLLAQEGGTLRVDGTFYVGYNGPPGSDANGTYVIYGGTADVGTLHIGQSGCLGYFYLLSPAATVDVSGTLMLDDAAVLWAVPGTTIHMTGARFDIAPDVDLASLSPGLRWLRLLFEGGAADFDPFEVAGEDLGPTLSGFHANGGNGAVYALTLGGADIGRVQLVNNRQHHDGTEALYVNTLHVGAGSELDLNGLNLYCVNCYVHPDGTVVNGALTDLQAGDYDGDGSVTMDDFRALPDCQSGPDGGIETGCSAFDFNSDHDIDLADFGAFQSAFQDM
jgi:hypothetical protein